MESGIRLYLRRFVSSGSRTFISVALPAALIVGGFMSSRTTFSVGPLEWPIPSGVVQPAEPSVPAEAIGLVVEEQAEVGNDTAALANVQELPVVMIERDAGGARHLVTGPGAEQAGFPLYRYIHDVENGMASACDRACPQPWTPLTVASVDAPANALVMPENLPGTLGTVPYGDHQWQVTYEGWPLYFYDARSAATSGQVETESALWQPISIGLNYAAQNRVTVSSARGTGERFIKVISSTVLDDFSETGLVEVGGSDERGWHLVELQQSYTQPVVVMQALATQGQSPAVIRLRHVTSRSFEFALDEWAYRTDYAVRTVSYLVVAAGVYTLPGGRVLQAGTIATNHRFQSVPFISKFERTPVVITQILTTNDAEIVVPRLDNVAADAFDIRVQEGEGSDGVHAVETVGYVAMEPGRVAYGGWFLEVGETPDRVTEQGFTLEFSQPYATPTLLTSIQTFDGSDPAGIHVRNLSAQGANLAIAEEATRDHETWHPSERVGYLLVGQANRFASSPASMLADTE